jgi:hypothetical protein
MERLTSLPCRRPAAARRRGVLLLIVLSMLTLFMMLGATYLVITVRAKAAARAFANASTGTQSFMRAAQGQALVDEAFLAVVRGNAAGAVGTGDTLLGDKYGTATPQAGRVVSGSTSGTAIITLSATGSGITDPAESLAGRVLTFAVPGLNNASVRILRSEPSDSGVKLFIPGGSSLSGVTITSAGIEAAAGQVGGAGPHFIVNGREFGGSPASGSTDANEPYDGYDSRNPFLANPADVTGSALNTFSYKSLVLPSGTATVDNDGDGVLDSGWLNVGLPPITDAAGTTLYPRAAILITDLDGRVNVNAHGDRNGIDNAAAAYPSTIVASGSLGLSNVATGTSTLSSGTFSTFPRGLGYGPAEISLDASGLFDATGAAASTGNLTLSGATASSDLTDSETGRKPPRIGQTEGRYGGLPVTSPTDATGPSIAAMPRAGTPYVNDAITAPQQAWIAATGTSYFTNPVRSGSPADLKGRMRIFTDDYGQPVFYKPFWSDQSGSRTLLDDETTDDPYELDLSRTGPRSGAALNPRARTATTGTAADAAASATLRLPDNIYTAGELEGLLRLHDPESLKLPRRLVALTGAKAGTSRTMITTDNWDSPVMTGTARAVVSKLITAATSSGATVLDALSMFAPETLMGHKLDLNRPFHSTNLTEPYFDDNNSNGVYDAGELRVGELQRQEFAKHFYCLLYAIAGNGGRLDPDPTAAAKLARELAQWAVNVVDFRDKDSVMTGFEFDNDLTDGWNVNGDLANNGTDTDRDAVWGSERPEVLITETACWHDRNTEDGSTSKKTTEPLPADQDEDYDQKRRPRGAFFFELYSPWRSQVAEYDPTGIKAVRRTVQGGTSSLLRAEPIPSELASSAETAAIAPNALGRFDRGATLSLSSTAPSGHPVWRILSLKRTDTATPTIQAPETSITGTMWRSFYFAKPPVVFVRTTGNGDLASGTNAIAYWPSASAISLTPQTGRVFGTGTAFGSLLLTGSGTSTFVPINTIFKNPTSNSDETSTICDATLTEPMITLGTDASFDPYAVVGDQNAASTKPFPIDEDIPLDNQAYATAGIGKMIGPDGFRTLLQNGRHANYFILHLQRLANPAAAWNKDTNPYVTVDTQPVDLVVKNTSDTGSNMDEPCNTGGTASANRNYDLLTKQRNYDDGTTPSTSGAAAAISLERGKTQASTGNDRDIWSARLNPTGANNNEKLLSIDTKTYRTSAGATTAVASPPTSAQTLGSLAARFGGGSAAPDKPFPWLAWSNRPFTSAAELALVPKGSAFQLTRTHATNQVGGTDRLDTGAFGHLPGFFDPVATISSTSTLRPPWNLIVGRSGTSGAPVNSSPSLWDTVHVPSPFAGSYQNVPTTTTGTTALAAVGLDRRPYGQIPHFREPGRININTITGTGVWKALLGTGTAGTAIQTWSGTAAPFNVPATTLVEALGRFHPVVSGTTSFVDTYTEVARDANVHPFFRYQTVSRLTNLVTVRSNVFAVWVTIGFSTSPTSWSEAGIDTGEIRRHRGFFIIDRSIPVGFEPGQDHNVRDAILVRRILQ